MSAGITELFFTAVRLPDYDPHPKRWAMLTREERAFAFGLPERLGRRYMWARSIVRETLGGHLGIPPKEVKWRLNAFGKPILDCDATLHFSYAYHDSSTAVLAACKDFPVGIDVLDFLGDEEAAEICALHFAELAPKRRGLAGSMARAWTQWEALLKAHGTGFAKKNPDAHLCSIEREPFSMVRYWDVRPLPADAWRMTNYEGQTYALLELKNKKPIACTIVLRCGTEAPQAMIKPFNPYRPDEAT